MSKFCTGGGRIPILKNMFFPTHCNVAPHTSNFKKVTVSVPCLEILV